MADAVSARQRLRASRVGDVEHLLERVGADHAGLPEQRLDVRVALRDRRDVRARRVAARPAARALHAKDRFAVPDPARDRANGADCRTSPDRGGRCPCRVLFPELEQVVAGYVGAIAGGDEGGKAEPALGGVIEDHEPERGRMRVEADAPPRREHGARGSRSVGRPGAYSSGPGSSGRSAGRHGAHELDERLLEGRALRTALGEARGHDEQAPRAGLRASSATSRTFRGRHGDDGELRRIRKISRGG